MINVNIPLYYIFVYILVPPRVAQFVCLGVRVFCSRAEELLKFSEKKKKQTKTNCLLLNHVMTILLIAQGMYLENSMTDIFDLGM